ncbi:hypothetical protein MPSEU_001013400 [Mayamaea pseudoterrestris]|nr:hypothetical protein MPSEU_001013400 [Mayamaea pseudoterrestris]
MSLAKSGSTDKYSAIAVEEPTAEAVCISSYPLVNASVAEQVVLVAPSDMPGGYEFAASVNGTTVTVKVPSRGVTQGDTFTATIIDPLYSHRIPTGRWRHGICDCLRYGCGNPMCWVACCWRPIALGQVMTRMGLNACGTPTSRDAYWTAFKVLALVFLGTVFVDQVITRSTSAYYLTQTDEYGNPDYSKIPASVILAWGIQGGMRTVYFFYMLFLMIRTRAHIRHKYQIPETSCRGCEDCCCSFWCSCCTVLQMAHHTADCDAYPGSCCTESGMPPEAPHVV